jgi:16S rRNA U516 pseudouridylate synthase RsuA-like enzyme
MEERLQKLISQAGIASRRHAEQMISAGQVTVNGKRVTELGSKADPYKDHIKVNGKLINVLLERREKKYVLLNKPKGYLTSVSDPEDRPLVTQLLPESLGKLHPVGRLDFNTEGLLLLTNDGDFTNFITSARNRVKACLLMMRSNACVEASCWMTVHVPLPAKLRSWNRRTQMPGLKSSCMKDATSRSDECLMLLAILFSSCVGRE